MWFVTNRYKLTAIARAAPIIFLELTSTNLTKPEVRDETDHESVCWRAGAGVDCACTGLSRLFWISGGGVQLNYNAIRLYQILHRNRFDSMSRWTGLQSEYGVLPKPTG